MDRLVSEDEAKELEVMSGRTLARPQYVEERKGTLIGIASLYHENDLREILILDVEQNLKKLTEVDVDQATSKELSSWSKWCHELEDKLNRVREAVRSGRLLLARENLDQLYELIPDAKDLTSYKKWLAIVFGR